MSLALRAEPEDASTAERLEASLTFIEAFYSDALTLPEEKQVLFDALAQIRLESERAEAERHRDDWASASAALVARAPARASPPGFPLPCSQGNW